MTDRSITIAVWITLAVSLVAFEAVARTSSGRIPTASRVVGLALRPILGRLVIALGWMWLGWHVFAR